MVIIIIMVMMLIYSNHLSECCLFAELRKDEYKRMKEAEDEEDVKCKQT